MGKYSKADTSGMIPASQLGSGTADSTKTLRGDRTWTVSGGGVSLPITESDVTNLTTDLAAKCATTDLRLSDARAPLAHTHVKANITDFTHASSHVTGGSDVIATVVAAGNAGLMSGVDKTKLDGIASGATVNSTDATLLNRANHTGTQAESTVTNLVTDLGAKEVTASKGAANGYASLDGSIKIPIAQIPTGSTVTTACVGNDSRLSDARTPLAHAHAESEVTNLVSDLAAKAPLASPTFTGTPAAPTASAGTNTTQLASTTYAMSCAPNASYRTILDCSGSHTAARVAGTYAMGQGDPLAISGTGTLYPLNTIFIASADYPTVNGLAPKLRIRAQLYTNDVAPTGNITVGLFPITRPATSGAAGVCIYTLGTVVTGSNGATFTNPAADGLLNAVGADFALPSDGHYVIGVVTTAAVATSAHVHVSASLQLRNA